MRVVLADDHALVRAGLRTLLQGMADVQVVGETGDGHEALALVERHEPDVILLDIGMPGMNGLHVLERIVALRSHTRAIILSMHATEEYVLTALRSGAAGYMLKDSSVPELELALRAVARGETYLSPAISKHVIDGYVQRLGPEQGTETGLTPRQREILQLVAEGHSTKAIAHRLNVSVKTVETHRAQLMNRLQIFDVAGLVRYAVRIGLVSPDK